MSTILDVRPSPIAGTWYTGNAKQLAAEIDRYLAQARLPELPGEVAALIAPHAGHRYSGPVAGYAFRAVQGKQYDLVVVVSPMHQPYPQAFLTSAHEAYATPLGQIPIDRQAVAAVSRDLEETLGVGITGITRDPEHSLEIELPFLQRALSGPFQLLPVMARVQSEKACRSLGEAIARAVSGKNVLLVASTDLSHFYTQGEAHRLDQHTLTLIKANDPAELLRAAETGAAFACGVNAVAAVLWAAAELGARKVEILNYATSGDVTGDLESVVGYGAVAVLR